MQNCTEYRAVFKWVQHTPMGQLKALTNERLQEVRETLVTEVREVGRALYWIEGALKLKSQEKQPCDGSPCDGAPRDGSPWGGTK